MCFYVPHCSDYKEYHTDKTVKFVVKMSAEKLAKAEQEGLHKLFKISNTISTNQFVSKSLFVFNMPLFIGEHRKYLRGLKLLKFSRDLEGIFTIYIDI